MDKSQSSHLLSQMGLWGFVSATEKQLLLSGLLLEFYTQLSSEEIHILL